MGFGGAGFVSVAGFGFGDVVAGVATGFEIVVGGTVDLGAALGA